MVEKDIVPTKYQTDLPEVILCRLVRKCSRYAGSPRRCGWEIRFLAFPKSRQDLTVAVSSSQCISSEELEDSKSHLLEYTPFSSRCLLMTLSLS